MSHTEHEIDLCYIHSVDLFKLGQRNFTAKYPIIFSANSFKSEPKFNGSRGFLFSGFRS